MAAPVAAPTANKIKTVLAVALAAAANHGLDLLSGCCSPGLRQASIPFRCLSNAIICDLRRRMSSIRRSSLISITLGLLTVIGASFGSLLLSRRQDNGSNAHLSLAFAYVGLARAGKARACPLRQLQECCFCIYRRAVCRVSASVAVTAVT